MKWSFHAMGTDVELFTLEETGQTYEAFGEAQSLIEEYERLLSRFLPDSDVSRVNACPGRWIQVHPTTLEVVQLAHAAFFSSGGLFNPCLGTQLEELGYDRNFYQIQPRRVNGHPEAFISPTLPISWDVSRNLLTIEPGYKLDLGGIAKGWIVEQAASTLEDRGLTSFVCSAGGDMVCRGGPWSIGIENPFHPGSCIVTIQVNDLAVATSSTCRRSWCADGQTVHHLIDPRTGKSSTTDLVQCTVLHTSLVKAEVAAKVAILLGARNAPSFLTREGAVEWFAVRTDGSHLVSQGMPIIFQCL